MATIVVGAGVFGVTTAIELRRRGESTTLVDPGPLPHPYAASTDISKAVRIDYGADPLLTELGERALDGWREWNLRSSSRLFHEVGFLLLTREPIGATGFEAHSLELLRRRGHCPERIDPRSIGNRFPAWNPDGYRDGYFNPTGGWVDSARVMRWLIETAVDEGVRLRTGCSVSEICVDTGRVVAARTRDGVRLEADRVVVASGAWASRLVPWLTDRVRPIAQPVLHFRPSDPTPFEAARFPVWGADISRTGWYGFPINDDGLVKVAHHGPGREADPGQPGEPEVETEQRFRRFLQQTFPALADAPRVGGRHCFYCDSFDSDFWIGAVPQCEGLFVATGGSGHAFKFAPELGTITADAIQGRPNRFAARFAWRNPQSARAEEARCMN